MRRSPAFGGGLAVLLAVTVASHAAGQVKSPTRQVSEAVRPLPEQMRDGAAVYGFRGDGLVELRAGGNGMICLADDPAREGFHVACYHASLEPFMARGRALRAQGIPPTTADSVRLAELDAGTLAMPERGAALYSLTHDTDAFDPAGDLPAGMRGLWVLYLPYATEASTGISALPSRDRPWLMYPGKATAHVMIAR